MVPRASAFASLSAAPAVSAPHNTALAHQTATFFADTSRTTKPLASSTTKTPEKPQEQPAKETSEAVRESLMTNRRGHK